MRHPPKGLSTPRSILTRIRTRDRGLTLIELLLSLIIVAILSSIAITSYVRLMETSDINQAKSDILEIESAIERYYLTNNGYPESLSDLGGSYASMLDPWGNPYQYLNLETAKDKGHRRRDRNQNPINSDYDLYSMGADGTSSSQLNAKHGRDDIVRANNGGFVGLGSDY